MQFNGVCVCLRIENNGMDGCKKKRKHCVHIKEFMRAMTLHDKVWLCAKTHVIVEVQWERRDIAKVLGRSFLIGW